MEIPNAIQSQKMLETFRGGITTAQKYIAIDAAALFAQYWGRGHGLKPEGKLHFEEFIRKMKAGERADPISNMQMLDGFRYTFEGSELLTNQGGILLLSNHSVEGPLRGYGNTAVIDYIFYQTTGERIRWVQGHGSSIVGKIHVALGQTMNTITVANGNGVSGAKELLRTLIRGESVGLYPEGVQKKELQRGDPRAGKIITLAANRGIPVFCASSYFSNDCFRLFIDALDNPIIKGRGNSPQAIVDYAMTTIASHLPENRRGFYKSAPIEFVREKI